MCVCVYSVWHDCGAYTARQVCKCVVLGARKCLSFCLSFVRFFNFFFFLLLLVSSLGSLNISIWSEIQHGKKRKKKTKIEIKYLEFSLICWKIPRAQSDTNFIFASSSQFNYPTAMSHQTPSSGEYILFSSMNCCSVIRAYHTYSYSPIVRWHNYPLSFGSGCETKKTCIFSLVLPVQRQHQRIEPQSK